MSAKFGKIKKDEDDPFEEETTEIPSGFPDDNGTEDDIDADME